MHRAVPALAFALLAAACTDPGTHDLADLVTRDLAVEVRIEPGTSPLDAVIRYRGERLQHRDQCVILRDSFDADLAGAEPSTVDPGEWNSDFDSCYNPFLRFRSPSPPPAPAALRIWDDSNQVEIELDDRLLPRTATLLESNVPLGGVARLAWSSPNELIAPHFTSTLHLGRDWELDLAVDVVGDHLEVRMPSEGPRRVVDLCVSYASPTTLAEKPAIPCTGATCRLSAQWKSCVQVNLVAAQ